VSLNSRSQLPRGLSCGLAAARLLRLWVRIPPWARMSVCCKCCVLSGRGLCDELITRPEESYWLWYIVVCDLENSWMRRPWPTVGCRARTNKQTVKLNNTPNILCDYKNKPTNSLQTPRHLLYLCPINRQWVSPRPSMVWFPLLPADFNSICSWLQLLTTTLPSSV
jgi:hypothetical protein